MISSSSCANNVIASLRQSSGSFATEFPGVFSFTGRLTLISYIFDVNFVYIILDGTKLWQQIFLAWKCVRILKMTSSIVKFISFRDFVLVTFITENTRSTTALLNGSDKIFNANLASFSNDWEPLASLYIRTLDQNNVVEVSITWSAKCDDQSMKGSFRNWLSISEKSVWMSSKAIGKSSTEIFFYLVQYDFGHNFVDIFKIDILLGIRFRSSVSRVIKYWWHRVLTSLNFSVFKLYAVAVFLNSIPKSTSVIAEPSHYSTLLQCNWISPRS